MGRGVDRGRPNINDVAARAGVSVATVSRALRGLENVSESTRRRVEDAARELEYHIDRRASRLATGRYESVGLVVPRIDTWYFSTVLAGIESVLGSQDDLLLVCIDDDEARARLVAGTAPLRKRVDGLVFVDVLLEPAEATQLAGAGLRVVTIGQEIGGFPSVTIDNEGATSRLAGHLVAAGDRTVALIGNTSVSGLPYLVPTKRRDGFLAGCAGAGHRPTAVVEVDAEGDGAVAGAAAMAQLLSEVSLPLAVFAISDELAIGALSECRRRGLRVPTDVAVAGFDDHPLASAFDLTTIRQDPHRQGSEAAELFLAAAEAGDSEPTQRVGTTALVIRGSTTDRGTRAEKSGASP